MAEIFLSYRRDDSTSATGRLADALEAHFGDDRVFRDREIGAGENFVEAIRRSVESATVVLVVVGRHWLGARDAAGRRRLDDPGDFVRLEIELALAARAAVVPVLVEGAAMPSAADLPPSLAEFSRCQAVELSDTRWRYDVDRLIEMLQARFAIDSDARAAVDRGASGRIGALTRLARRPHRPRDPSEAPDRAPPDRTRERLRRAPSASSPRRSSSATSSCSLGIDLPGGAAIVRAAIGVRRRRVGCSPASSSASSSPRVLGAALAPGVAHRRRRRRLSPRRPGLRLRVRRRLARLLRRRCRPRRRRAAGRPGLPRPRRRCA